MSGLLLSLLCVLIVSVLSPPLYALRGMASYTPLHTLLEVIAIVVSSLVFAVGWSVYQKERIANFMAFACCFLGVAMLDFLHTLSYQGMPFFITENSPEKAIDFWLAARALAALALLSVAFLPQRLLTNGRMRWLMLCAVLAAVCTVFWIVIWHPQWTPSTFEPGQGLTPFKKICEYALIVIYALAAWRFFLKADKPQIYDVAHLFGAACTMVMSEFFFTLYADVTDIFNLLGHIYKVIAYGLIYRSVFVASIEIPYQRLSQTEAKFHAIVDESPVAYALYDARQNLSYLNPAFIAVFGYTLEDVPTLADWWLKACPDYRYRQWLVYDLQQHREAALATGNVFVPLEIVIRCKNGDSRTVIVGEALLGNHLDGFHVLVLNDITARVEAMNKLADSHNMLQTVINTIPSRVFWKDLNSRYLGCNLAFSRDAGAETPDAVIGKLDSELTWRLQSVLYRADDWLVMNSNAGKLGIEEPQTTPTGETVWRRASKVALRDLDNQVIGVLGVYDDVTEYKQAEEDMRLASLVYQNSSEAMLVTDGKGTIINVNPAFTQITGYTAAEIIGKTPAILRSRHHDQAFYKTIWHAINTSGQWSGEIWGKRKNGEDCVQQVTINSILDEQGAVYRRVVLIADVTDKKRAEDLIWRQANLDPLTQLPNRNMFLDRLAQEIKNAHRHGSRMALMFIDLDRFKDVNDTLGHFMGDILLKQAAQRLNESVRETDSVARLGGDEFTVIVGELEKADSVERVAQCILSRFAEPFCLGKELAYISASIGIAFYPDDALDIDSLLKNADQAMYEAKYLGRDRYSYFTVAMQEKTRQRMRLANDLHGAVAENQFMVYYQPIVNLADNTICKAEALIRWQHPVLGLVSPAEFIPVAEDTGIIVEIGDWVFRSAARQVGEWRHKYRPDFQVSVNKSPVQFRKSKYEQPQWLEELRQLGLSGRSIVVEITEGLLLDADNSVNEQLCRFREEGMEVALDDFGTGYSALAYLKKFDIDYIKIDQAFVCHLVADSSDMALCEAIIVMAHKLGIKVVAEGIETLEQYRLLFDAGCDYGQGYLFSRPLPVDQFEQLLEAGLPAVK
jgi:diguanylate cyclase (GGDEF)-like protein/PAS domain S-box-containing protein